MCTPRRRPNGLTDTKNGVKPVGDGVRVTGMICRPPTDHTRRVVTTRVGRLTTTASGIVTIQRPGGVSVRTSVNDESSALHHRNTISIFDINVRRSSVPFVYNPVI